MGTSRTIARSTMIALVMLLALPVVCTDVRNALFIDGQVRASGVPLDGTRVIIERDGVQINVLTGNVARVDLRLDLGHVYLLSFEREGCMTKELLFDTNVPEESLALAPFTFPFKVTLEKRDLDATFRYAKPVGYIRYHETKKDFDFDTDHALHRDRLVRSKRAQASSVRNLEPVGTGSVVSDGPSTVHDAAKAAPEPNAITSTREPPLPDQMAVSWSAGQHVDSPTLRVRQAVAPGPGQDLALPPTPDGRTDELIVEPTYVARVVRITHMGRTREYRRVAHRFGETHYFLDGSSCGEATFSAGIHED